MNLYTHINSGRRCIIFALLLPFVSGCGNEAAELPAPGKMRVLAVSPLHMPAQEALETNLITNGNFLKWWPASPVGDAFGAPDPEYSSLVRKGDAVRAYALQTWTKPDGALNAMRQLRTQVDHLEADTLYRLSVTASNVSNAGVALAVYSLKGENIYPLFPSLIHLLPSIQEGVLKHYHADFKLDEPGSILIAASLLTPISGATTLVWREWRLYPVESAK